MKRKKETILVVCLFMVIGLWLGEETIVKANPFQDSILFYDTYGSNTVFKGEWFYYGSRGITASGRKNSTTWSVVGHQIKVIIGEKEVVLYFQKQGEHTIKADEERRGSYTYGLYGISLEGILEKLQQVDKIAYGEFLKGKGRLEINSCMITINWNWHGVPSPSGGMTYDGKRYGTVYTTYEGIANAAHWIGKESLRSYFEKNIIYETKFYTTQVVYARYQEEDGEYGGYKEVLRGDYIYGSEVLWQNIEDDCYEAAIVRYEAVEDGKRYIDVKRKRYDVTVAGDIGIAKVNGAGRYYYGQTCEIEAVLESGYVWEGWSGTQEVIGMKSRFIVTRNNDLKAKASAIRYMIYFHPNGGSGEMEPLQCDYNVRYEVPKETFKSPEEQSVFKGWAKSDASSEVEWKKGDEIYNYSSENGTVIHLYAIWDYAPALTVADRYFTLVEAKEGIITEEELKKTSTSVDGEEGELNVSMKEFDTDKFLRLTADSEVPVTYFTEDTSGNYVEERASVFVVDTERIRNEEKFKKGYVRFISSETYRENSLNGGVEKNSVWRVEEEYREVLESLFQ